MQGSLSTNEAAIMKGRKQKWNYVKNKSETMLHTPAAGACWDGGLMAPPSAKGSEVEGG